MKHAFVKLFILPFFTLLTFPSCVVLVRERTTQIIGIACKDEDFSYMETQIMETQIFHHAKIQPSKNPPKETKILEGYQTLELISSFQHKPKHQFSKKILIKKNRPIIYYLGAYKNPLSYYTL